MNKTKVIRVFETFAGIGAQHKAISNIDKSNKHFKIVKTSEWDARAIIAYSQIHKKDIFDKNLKIVDKWSDKKISNFLKSKTISLNSKSPSKIERKNKLFKQNLISAIISNNNIPDITKVIGDDINGIDLITYSFPCQGLSIANMGRDKGINIKSDSASNLIWEIRRILLEVSNNGGDLPKYLLMENVKNLVGKKHINDYNQWTKFLSELGYTTKTILLNGTSHNSLQRRERVFGISILNWEDESSDKDFNNWFNSRYKRNISIINKRKKYMEILNSSNQWEDEIKMSIPNNTPSRMRMATSNKNLLKRTWIKGQEWTFNTLTTKQDRHPNIGMIDLPSKNIINGKLSKRFITPREAYLIMGFESKDFSNVKLKYDEGIITKESLYRQAGNSIVVSILEDIFKFISEYEGGKC